MSVTSSKATGAPEFYLIEHTRSVTRSLPAHVIRLPRSFDSVSTGSSEDADLVPVQSGEDWIARLDDDLSRPVEVSGDSFIFRLYRRKIRCA